MSNFNKCLNAVLKHEGGFIKHPKQPDLSSNSGITKKVYEGWAKKSVTEDQLESLSKTEIALFYKEKYWKVLQCDDLPHGVDLIVFDFAISAGPYKAVIKLQQAVNCYLDGNMGPQTIEAVNSQNIRDVINKYKDLRLSFYRNIPGYDAFGASWEDRTEDITNIAISYLPKYEHEDSILSYFSDKPDEHTI